MKTTIVNDEKCKYQSWEAHFVVEKFRGMDNYDCLVTGYGGTKIEAIDNTIQAIGAVINELQIERGELMSKKISLMIQLDMATHN